MGRDPENPKTAKCKKHRAIDENPQLRERIGKKDDVAIALQRLANFGKPISDADTLAQQRVSYQPDIAAPGEPEPQVNSSRRFKRFWATLTRLQKETMRRVYIKNPERLSKTEIARLLGIRVDTLQERLDYAIKKLKKVFPELVDDRLRRESESVDEMHQVAEQDRNRRKAKTRE